MTITRRTWLTGTLSAAVAATTGLAHAQPKYDPGASDKEIVLGTTQPLSGPASPYATLGRTMLAYFEMLNEQGGINGRKVRLLLVDDGYVPPQTVDATRRLVEGDKVLMTVGALGTPTQLAVSRYMNVNKVPQLFVSAPAGKLASARTLPWTITYNPVYEIEGAVYAAHLANSTPQAKIAILSQDDEAGRALHGGFVQALAKRGMKPHAEQTYQVTDPTIDSQIIQLKASGADTIFLVTMPRMTAFALRKIASLGWKPTIYISAAGASVKGALEPAGLENAVGVYSSGFRKNVSDPRWDNDPDVVAFRALVGKYLTGVDGRDEIAASGYDTAVAVHQVLKMAGDDLTRANIMKIVSNLKGFRTPLLLPGVTFDTTPDDYQGFKRLQMTRFDGKSFLPAGDLVAAP